MGSYVWYYAQTPFLSLHQWTSALDGIVGGLWPVPAAMTVCLSEGSCSPSPHYSLWMTSHGDSLLGHQGAVCTLWPSENGCRLTIQTQWTFSFRSQSKQAVVVVSGHLRGLQKQLWWSKGSLDGNLTDSHLAQDSKGSRVQQRSKSSPTSMFCTD